jgi:cell wall-associated NlpC family hydrolase
VEPPTDARDTLGLPQDLGAYMDQAALDVPLIPAAKQEQLLARFRKAHYAPWTRVAPVYSRQDALWGLGQLKRNRHYGENLRLLGPGFKIDMEWLAQAETYPNLALPAIATANLNLRVVPSNRPGFLKPVLPGEGYPFDYWQNSGAWAGTPLFVTQISADGAWVLVETRFAGGWVPTTDIAFVDEAFMARWMSLPLVAVTRERTSVIGEAEAAVPQEIAAITPSPMAAMTPSGTPPTAPRAHQNATVPAPFLFQGRIGTVLPLVGEDNATFSALAPVRGTDGRAVLTTVQLAKNDAAPLPMAPTPRNFVHLANQMMGQPYGWGGYLENRDCSALLLDLYAPFGIFLPRNSRQQAKTGQVVSLDGLSPAQKEERLRTAGAPLLTLVHKPGHIMLYIGQGKGQYAGRSLIMHAIWGLKTKGEQGAEGRFVIGRTAITTLEPGRELPEVARVGTLLQTIDTMTLVAPVEDFGLGGRGGGQTNGQANGQTNGQSSGQASGQELVPGAVQ